MNISRPALTLNKRGLVVPDMVFPGLHSASPMPGHELVDLRSLGILPGTLALAAGLQDGLSALWTLRAWRGESASAASRPR